ncbi:RNA-guided endonuclease InsQ/TnpB family protein [Streptomyces nigrescens]
MTTQEVLRAYRFVLDPSESQAVLLARYAGAARWAFNHALAVKQAEHQRWRTEVQALVDSGMTEAEARKRIKLVIPSKPAIQKAWVAGRGDSRCAVDGSCSWWWEVNNHCFQSGFIDADAAWRNWLSSFRGQRDGRRVGYPRYKKKGRSRESFRLHHDVKRPSIRLVGYRRINLPKFGEVRIHNSGKHLARLVGRGQAVIQSVTVSRAGSRWYASVLCKVQQEIPQRLTARQRAGGVVGVDLGSTHLAVLSGRLRQADCDSDVVEHPRHLQQSMERLTKAQRALSKTVKGSVRRVRAARKVARIYHEIAERRATYLHGLTKQLAENFSHIAVEGFDVQGLMKRPPSTLGEGRRASSITALFNRHLMDAAPGEVRRQLAYKALWYGATMVVLEPGEPVNRVCSRCGSQNPHVSVSVRRFDCWDCGFSIGRRHNAAQNIRSTAQRMIRNVPSGSGETENARGVAVRPSAGFGGGRAALKREDIRVQCPDATPRE